MGYPGGVPVVTGVCRREGLGSTGAESGEPCALKLNGGRNTRNKDILEAGKGLETDPPRGLRMEHSPTHTLVLAL